MVAVGRSMDFLPLAITLLALPPLNPDAHVLPGRSSHHQGVVMVVVVLVSVVRVRYIRVYV